MNDKRMVDGVEVVLTDAEQIEHNQKAVDWAAGAAARAAAAVVPDLTTQLLALLLAKNVVAGADVVAHVDAGTLDKVNAKLAKAGLPAIGAAKQVNAKAGS